MAIVLPQCSRSSFCGFCKGFGEIFTYFFLTGCVSLPTYIKSCSKTSRETGILLYVHCTMPWLHTPSYCPVLCTLNNLQIPVFGYTFRLQFAEHILGTTKLEMNQSIYKLAASLFVCLLKKSLPSFCRHQTPFIDIVSGLRSALLRVNKHLSHCLTHVASRRFIAVRDLLLGECLPNPRSLPWRALIEAVLITLRNVRLSMSRHSTQRDPD